MKYSERNPYDGLPYYCAACGAPLSEFNACEDDCRLESKEVAEARMLRRRPVSSAQEQQ
jgi:hypothetical protein